MCPDNSLTSADSWTVSVSANAICQDAEPIRVVSSALVENFDDGSLPCVHVAFLSERQRLLSAGQFLSGGSKHFELR